MSRKRCFVIIPFKNEFKDTFDDIRAVVESMGLECRRGDHHKQPGAVMEQIERDIEDSDLIIADLSGGNLNVFYEVGIAHSARRPPRTILLARVGEEIPYDLRSQRYLEYESHFDGREPFRQNLRDWISNALQNFPEDEGALVGKLTRTQHIIDAARKCAEEWHESPAEPPRIIRMIAGLASLAISEHELTKEPSPGSPESTLYARLLGSERDHLLDLLDQGASIRMILTPPDSYEPSRGWIRLALRMHRLILLLQGKSDSNDPERLRKDALVSGQCSIAIASVSEPNTLILGDKIAFEVFRRGKDRGFEGTYWTTKREQISELISTFDARFIQIAGSPPTVPIDQQPTIERLKQALSIYRASVGEAWDEAVFFDLPSI